VPLGNWSAKHGAEGKMNQQTSQQKQPSQPTQQPAAGKPARQSQAPGVAGGPKSNMAIIIIAIVLGAVIVLGVGGYLAWKYYIKGKLTTTADKTTNTNSGAKVSLKSIFTYPTGTLTKTDRTPGLNFVSELGFSTTDKLQTVYDYYLNLATKQKLTVSAKTLEPDLSYGTITIQGQGYYVVIALYQYDNTEFTVTIYGDNITNDTANASTNTNTPSNANSSAKTAISDEYIIADSGTRVITTAELTNLTPWQLKVARNEIYARHGREFVHKDLNCYFATKSWYSVNPGYSEGLLTSTDTKNVATILAYEQSINSPLLQVDSGC
jgi:hypothetical protein